MPFTVKKLTPIRTDNMDSIGQGLLDLAKYVEDEFGYVASALQSTEPDTIWNRVPPRPRRGTYAYADGTNWNPGFGEGPYYFNGSLWLPMGGAVRVLHAQVFTTLGAQTYTPSAGLVFAIMEAQGGGGAGGGANNANAAQGYTGCGGDSGCYSKSFATAATIGASQTVTIGAGGTPGAAGANPGGNGGQTSIGSLCIAPGGFGGQPCSNAGFGLHTTPNAAGTGNMVALPSRCGGPAYYATAYSTASYALQMGWGADSMFGGGGIGGWNAGTGNTGTGYGSGGGGGSWVTTVNTAAGGAGRQGIAVITEFCSR